jgi:hypothetical protein
MTDPVRLPDAASLETILAGLDRTSADANLIPSCAFQPIVITDSRPS